jgi:hypothetical protein
MENNMKKKKAIEPLIASILLIVVAVILVAIVLSWGKNFSLDGLNGANEFLDEDCSGILSIQSCEILADGNIVMQVKNISSNYTFKSEDLFQIMIKNNSGSGVDEEVDLTFTSDWQGLESGQSIIAKQTSTLTSGSNANVDVLVRSTLCPQATVTWSNCHK